MQPRHETWRADRIVHRLGDVGELQPPSRGARRRSVSSTPALQEVLVLPPETTSPSVPEASMLSPMTAGPSLSLVIPVYNAADQLPATLLCTSARQQRQQEFFRL